ncbi:MAG: dipeptide epimerase, partial [Pedobacter sp.]
WYDDQLPELCANTTIPIMADESCYNHHDARMLIKRQATEHINIKFAKSGGILEAQKIHETAAQHGVKCMMGGMLESRLAASAFLHFALASPNVVFYDMDTCMLGHLEDPIKDGLTYSGYFLDIPEIPGIGADVKQEFLDKCDKWVVE